MGDTVTFGPEGDRWLYNRSTKTYDLTRGKHTQGFTIQTTQGPPGTSFTVDPEKTALIVVDMQNTFLHNKCRDHPTGLATVEPTLTLIHKCRKLGIQVIWLNWGLTEEDLASMPAVVSRSFARSLVEPSHPVRRLGFGADLGDGMGRTLMAGEWNSALYAPLAAAVNSLDKHLPKNRMSGLWNEQTPLWRYLMQSGHRTLMFAGVNTDQCVLGTLTNAYNAGWDCVMVEDCCATTTDGGHDVCVHNVAGSYGFVIDSKSFTAGKSA
ncbi:isochorismatase [Truncatella angustata]|uniref:Isochorismatase n=1 Tax=Truncatella angustata TaxID=152316 RepID=A0A9P8URV2_9PEZI|nr:isochorismatase [Truncatella angustata]KAH6657850.1 isochorismatase [Truncatella angustata]